MTRTARKEKKKYLEATPWNKLKGSKNEGRVSKKTPKQPLKGEGLVKTLKDGSDLVNIVNTTTNKKGLKNVTKNGSFKQRNGRNKKGDNVDERRLVMREKRRLRRAKLKECFGCRKPGHRLEECPERNKKGGESAKTGLCFKCGSTEHGVSQCKAKLPPGSYPYATCFVCGETGHLTRSCPDNPKGLYPHGGCCSLCGSVEHLKTNCPEKHSVKKGQQSVDSLVQLNTDNSASADADTLTTTKKRTKATKNKTKIVKF